MSSTGAEPLQWAQTDFGTTLDFRPTLRNRRSDELFSVCEAEGSMDNGLPPGSHRGELVVEIAGMANALPPLLFDLEVAEIEQQRPDQMGTRHRGGQPERHTPGHPSTANVNQAAA